MPEKQEHSNQHDTELGSVNIIQLILQNKKLFITITILTVVVSAVVSLIIPEKYKSVVTLFPTVPENSLGQTLTDERASSELHLLAIGEKIVAERFLQIINSTTVKDKVIEANNLYEHYEIKPDDPKAKSYIYEEYGSNVSANLTRYESIDIEVFDKDPEKAAAIANSIAAFSDSLELSMRIQRARLSFETAKNEHKHLMRNLHLYEDSVAELRSRGVIDFYTQVPELTEEYSNAIGKGHLDRAAIIKRDLDTLGKYGHSYQRVAKKLERIRELENVVYRRMELFRIDLNDRLPGQFIVDEAFAADKKSYPIRWLIVALSTIAAVFMTIVVLLILENFKLK